MKKTLVLIALIATAFTQNGIAQLDHHTENTTDLLPIYYEVKDALIVGNTTLAAAKAAELVKAISGTEEKTVDKPLKESLLKHAGMIASSKDLKSQREHFSTVSEDMIVLAKKSKLSHAPAYQMYCPMKKSNWLSNEKTVRNPYYGSAMLNCGKVVGTIK